MVQIKWTPQSVKDLEEIHEFISRDSRTYAKRQIQLIRNRTHILKSNVNAGKVVKEMSNRSIRELIEGNYRIIYKIKDVNRIDILTIHHGARNLRKRKLDK